MKILVTGGAGFIGSHLVDKLLGLNYKVTVIDNFDPFYSRDIKEANILNHLSNVDYRLIEADIRDVGLLEKELDQSYDAIVHLAAKAGVRPSIKNPLEYQSVNVEGTQNMLELARKRDIRQFVFASSSSVYGNNRNVPWSENDNVLQPISPYASTKVSGELLGHVYSHLYDIRFIALRFFTVYGPRQRPDLAIHKFMNLMSNNESITLYGDGSTRRDYTYIDDIVSGILGAINYNDTNYEVINLGNNKTVTLKELVESLEKVSEISASKEKDSEQPGDVKQTWADIHKAKRLLNYDADFTLEKGLSRFVNWYSQQGIEKK